MDANSIALFIHIVGALGLFVVLGLEWTGLWQIRSAMTIEQVRAWMSILKNVRKIGFISMLASVITGAYMMLTDESGAGWISVTVGSLALLIVLSQTLTSPRMAAIGRALFTEKSFLPGTYQSLANQPLLWISIQSRIAIALGIVFLKTAKPDLGGSLLSMGVAIILGLASTLYFVRRERALELPSN